MLFRKKPVQQTPETSSAMRTLIQRLSLGPQSSSPRIITFIAARPKEGTSTVARDYASALATETGQKVLLIDAGPLVPERFRSYGLDPSEGMIDATLAGQLPDKAIKPISTNVSVGHWIGHNENQSLAGKVIYNPKFWESLLSSYNTIVIDAPSLQSTFDGIVLAAKADATVMVVESETTPQAVVKNLRDTLAASGAKLAGVVMNKRRYYIPTKVYKKL